MRNRWIRIFLLIALPLILFVIVAEQRSWQPRTLFIGTSNFPLAFSSDNEMLIVGRHKSSWQDLPQNFQLWNVSSGQLQRTLPDSRSHLTMAAFAPNEKIVAGVAGVGAVKLWDAQTGKLQRTLSKPMSEGLATACIAFSPDSKILAEGRGDGGNYAPPYPGTLLLWDTQTGALRHTLNTGGNTVSSFFFSPDGHVLIGVGLYAVQVWDVPSGSLLCKLKANLPSPSPAFSSDGKTLAIVDKQKTVMLWDVRTGVLRRKLNGHKGLISAIVFAPNGRNLAVVSNQTGLSGTWSRTLTGAISFYGTGPGVPIDGEVRLWDTQTGMQLHTFKNSTKPINSVAFSPDSRMIGAGSDFEAIVWEIATGKLLRKLIGHRKTINSLAFAPDGRTLATASEDQTAKLWRIK